MSAAQSSGQMNKDLLSNIIAKLNSSIAYKVTASAPWTFYETLDKVLGPYGNMGYPLYSGKFYCMAFNANIKLMNNPTSASWIKLTTVKLQETIRDFVIDSLQKGKSGKITDIELRSCVNRAYSYIYDDQSINSIIELAPELLPILKTMQGRETLTFSTNFRDILNSTLGALETFIPGMIDSFTSCNDLPEFKGEIKMYFNRTRTVYPDEQTMNRNLFTVSSNLMGGKLDDREVLNYFVNQLKFKNFTDELHSKMSREIVLKSQTRLSRLENYYAPLRIIRPNMGL